MKNEVAQLHTEYNMSLDSTTIIAGVLGFFFLIVAMMKNFGRKKNNRLYIPGTAKPQDDDQEIKLSDPFSSPKPASTGSTVANSGDQVDSKTIVTVEKSSFKQFTQDSSIVSDVKPRDDNDYQWE